MARGNAEKRQDYQEKGKQCLDKERKTQKHYNVATAELSQKDLKQKYILVNIKKDLVCKYQEKSKTDEKQQENVDFKKSSLNSSGIAFPLMVSFFSPQCIEFLRKWQRWSGDQL